MTTEDLENLLNKNRTIIYYKSCISDLNILIEIVENGITDNIKYKSVLQHTMYIDGKIDVEINNLIVSASVRIIKEKIKELNSELIKHQNEFDKIKIKY